MDVRHGDAVGSANLIEFQLTSMDSNDFLSWALCFEHRAGARVSRGSDSEVGFLER